MRHDVIVVGAGLSGLVCAYRLAQAGRSVLVLEARDRVGGRLHSIPFAGTTIDLGGQWMSVGQPRLAALAAELGVATFSQERAGAPLFALDDRGFFARVGSALARWRAARHIKRLARHPPANDRSLADYLDKHIHHPSARELVAMHAELVFAVDPTSLSLLHYLRTFSTTGGFSPSGPDLPGGGREHRFVGGAQSLALQLAARLGDAVRLASRVTKIVDNTDSVDVHTTSSEPLVAKHVVLALPPSLARHIDIDLPAATRELVAQSHLGAVVKCFAAYDRAFWRDAGLSGEAFRPRGNVRATVALTSRDSDRAILLAFVVGPPARTWHTRSADERRAEVIATLVEQFGDAAADPIDYTEVDWSIDPLSTGCVASLPPNALTTAATWRTSHGRIHFAGTESAEQWPGYMEGAIDAAERVASALVPA